MFWGTHGPFWACLTKPSLQKQPLTQISLQGFGERSSQVAGQAVPHSSYSSVSAEQRGAVSANAKNLDKY